MLILKLLTFLFLPTIHTQPSPYGFNIQFIGNTRYVSASEESQREFCSNFWCTNDAEILFTRSSQYKSSDPCVDFKNFSIGTALDVSVVNERYFYRGFVSEIEFKFWEKLRRILMKKINKNEASVVKVAKNVFQKCTKSRHVLRHLDGHKEVIDYLNIFGGSPYLLSHVAWMENLQQNHGNSTTENYWNEQNFKLSKLFEHEPRDALWLLLSYELQRCGNEVLCLKFVGTSKFDKNVNENLLEVLEYMNDNFIAGLHGKIELRDNLINPAIENVREFSNKKEFIVKNIKISEISFKKVKILELNDISKELEVEWLKVVNNQLLQDLKVDENEEILIENFELFYKMAENLKLSDKRITADYFTLTYLFLYQFISIFHFDEKFVSKTVGTKKSLQRWETCLIYTVSSYLNPALIFLFEDIQIDENSTDKLEKFVDEAVTEAKKKFLSENNLSLKVATDVLQKLKTVKILASLNHRNFTRTMLDEFYKELDINGSEKFFESYLEMKKFNTKVKLEIRGNIRRKIEELAEMHRITYDIENGNVIYIPPMWKLYPWYHPKRPRFFNMATMFIQILIRIHFGIVEYVRQKFHITSQIMTGLEDSTQIAYNHYTTWLKYNKDFQIGANFLTNPQLFWMARAVYHYSKYHSTIPENLNEIQRLQIDYMHVEFKSKRGFQEAFMCIMSDDEWIKFREYQKKYLNILRNIELNY